MPDDTQIQKYSHTVNPDGADGEKSGNGKAAVSLEKDAGSTVGTGQSGKGDSSYNNYNTEQWGKNKISEQPEDKDNTTEEEWYEEGVVLECHIDYYSNENGEEKEEKQYKNFEAGRYIYGRSTSSDNPMVNEMLDKITKERRQIEEELLQEKNEKIVKEMEKGNLVGNVAVAEVNMKRGDERLNDIIIAYSNWNNAKPYHGYKHTNDNYACERQGDDKIFDTLELDNWGNTEGSYVYDRSVDSETKILEEIAHRLNMEKGQVDKMVEGTIYLATDRKPCTSCREVIQQFQKMFPNVKVVIIFKYKPTNWW